MNIALFQLIFNYENKRIYNIIIIFLLWKNWIPWLFVLVWLRSVFFSALPFLISPLTILFTPFSCSTFLIWLRLQSQLLSIFIYFLTVYHHYTLCSQIIYNFVDSSLFTILLILTLFITYSSWYIILSLSFGAVYFGTLLILNLNYMRGQPLQFSSLRFLELIFSKYLIFLHLLFSICILFPQYSRHVKNLELDELSQISSIRILSNLNFFSYFRGVAIIGPSSFGHLRLSSIQDNRKLNP